MATAQRTLRALARQQFGLVSALNVRDLGITQKAIQSLLSREVLTKDIRGVYRFTDEPLTEGHELAADVLWTQRRDAALSHETALAVRGIADLTLDTVHHVTVPRAERIRIQPLSNLTVHYEDIDALAIERWNGLNIVSPAEALRQIIDGGTYTRAEVENFIGDAQAKAMLTDDSIARLTARLDARG
jgi:predicted transcriptional regulator of viral defense system